MDLNIEEFNPTKAEVISLAQKFKGLSIKGIDDVAGYKAVHDAQMTLVHTRTNIVKASKDARQKAVDFNRAVLALEKDLIAEIEPVEKELKEKKETIDREKELIERRKLIPARREKLIEVEVELTDDQLIEMDSVQFQNFLNQAKHEQLERREAAIKAEQERLAAIQAKIDADKRDEEIRKQAELDAKKRAAEEAEIAAKKAEADRLKAKADAEASKLRAVEEAKAQAEREKQAIIDENNRKERERLAAIEAEKEAEAQRMLEEETNKKALEKTKKMQKFLKDNGVTDQNKSYFIINHEGPLGQHIVLWKKIAEIDL